MSTLRPQEPGIPTPLPSPTSAPYWEGCAAGELRFQRCRSCQTVIADAARICWHCHGRDLAWEVSTGRGRLSSWTVVWRPQTPEFHVPYSVAIVRLEEGFEIVSSVVGCEPEELTGGMELAVEFHPASSEIVLPYFRPARGSST